MKKSVFGLAMATTLLSSSVFAEVRMGIAAEPYPPFAEQSASGEWVGWEVEIIDAVCAAMEEECEIVPVAWDGIIPALLANKIDVIMASMSITEERQKTIDFSDKYYNTPAVFVSNKESDIDGSPESLEGKIVGVQVSTTHANYVDKHFGEFAEVKYYSQFDEHNQDLVAGRIDAVVGDSLAFSELEAKINAAIQKIRDDGTFDEISKNYFDFDIFGG